MRLYSFLTAFLLIYAAVHALVFAGLRPLVRPWPWFERGLVGAMVLLLLMPLLARLLERKGAEEAARVLAVIGYTWMGLVFLAFSVFAVVFLWNLAVWPVTRWTSAPAQLILYGPRTAATILTLVLLVGIYGFFEAGRLRVETIRVETDKLPPQVAQLRVAQISDLHLGLIHREKALRRVVKVLEEIQPDLLVATGDIVDAQIDHINGLSEIFAGFAPPLGKFAVTGNHEFYAGLGQSLRFTDRSGFVLLRNRAVNVGGILQIAGVDDPAGRVEPDDITVLQGLDPGLFTLLLKHRPVFYPGAGDYFDLQLSGHTHGGQIFPFDLLSRRVYPMQDGLFHLPGPAMLYTSRGTGTWGPPMRVLSPPEITVFEIVRRQ